MGFDFEALGDDRFQRLCQSLLVKEFASVQCLPTGMADGGRDATGLSVDLAGRVVFQVKFSDSPRAHKDPAAWMIAAITPELPKIARLKSAGSSDYIVITNIAGTSVPSSGSIDRVQVWLDQNSPLPALCWWRDDVARRLDASLDVKLAYPELLSGTDMLHLLLSRLPDTARDRRANALRSYLAHQHAQDRTIRFKQADDLNGDLFDLFVDVPIDLDPFQQGALLLATDPGYPAVADMLREQRSRGAAALLLDPRGTSGCYVIEGAPGQGKSTLTQCLAEVHRTRLLQLADHTVKLPDEYATAPLMLPIRIELRELAAWLAGEDPFGAPRPRSEAASTVEAALAAQIAAASGSGFDVDDLLQVLATTPTLLLLDALDEVPASTDRHAVVEALQAFIHRRAGFGGCLQVVATSRPTADEQSPVLAPQQFVYLSLAPLTSELVMQYTDRWARTRGMSDEQASELASNVRTQIATTHTAELASNTMQLAILLMLIRLRSVSLPERRTDLYDAYINVFLDREAEKNDVVRDHRHLIVNFHQHLAFRLHADAELQRGGGRISHAQLRGILAAYLDRNDHDPALLEPILSGTVTRSVAVVSRIQGTVEFEVQPLREYLAARHLYNSSPYATAANEPDGGKMARFNAIALNPYWSNVARFFAGCFTAGELLGLADQVATAIAGAEPPHDGNLRALATALLRDRVFEPAPKAARALVAAVFDEPGITWARAAMYATAPGVHMQLAERPFLYLSPVSAAKLTEHLWPGLEQASDPLTEHHLAAARLLAPQRGAESRAETWLQQLRVRQGSHRHAWIRIGAQLRALADADHGVGPLHHGVGLADVPDEELLALVASDVDSDRLSDADQHAVAKAVLNDGGLTDLANATEFGNAGIGQLARLTDPHLWVSLAVRPGQRGDLPQRQGRMNRYGKTMSPSLAPLVSSLARAEHATGFSGECVELRWAAAVNTLEAAFGPTLASMEIAVHSARRMTGSSKQQMYILAYPGTTSVHTLCTAQLKAADERWWQEQAEQALVSEQRVLWVLALVAFASRPVLLGALPALQGMVGELSERWRDRLAAAAYRTFPRNQDTPKGFDIGQGDTERLVGDPAGTLILAARVAPAKRMPVLVGVSARVIRADTATVCLDRLAAIADRDTADPDTTMQAVSHCHLAGAQTRLLSSRAMSFLSEIAQHPRWAVAVRAYGDTLPDVMVLALRTAPRYQAGRQRRAVPIADIAEEQHWFEH